MKILFLHGLESTLSEQKKNILEQFGEVFAPLINYREEKILQTLVNTYKEFDVLIGSSMGGYTGYLISSIYEKPCLLFNPALVYRSVQPDITGVDIPLVKNSYTRIILGKQDELIRYEDNVKFIERNLHAKDLEVKTVENMAHRTPAKIFRDEVRDFFEIVSERKLLE